MDASPLKRAAVAVLKLCTGRKAEALYKRNCSCIEASYRAKGLDASPLKRPAVAVLKLCTERKARKMLQFASSWSCTEYAERGLTMGRMS